MSFTIDITADMKGVAKTLDNLKKKQPPFAISLTLNDLAVAAQEEICNNIFWVFYNRTQWWDRRQKTGIKVSFSHKSNLISAVYTKVHFASIQEEGGIKKPYRSSNLAIPTSYVRHSNRSSRALRMEENNRSIFKLGRSIYRRLDKNTLQRIYSL